MKLILGGVAIVAIGLIGASGFPEYEAAWTTLCFLGGGSIGAGFRFVTM